MKTYSTWAILDLSDKLLKMSFAISAILLFTMSSDKGTESILLASFRPSNIGAIFTALGFISFSPAACSAVAFVIVKET